MKGLCSFSDGSFNSTASENNIKKNFSAFCNIQSIMRGNSNVIRITYHVIIYSFFANTKMGRQVIYSNEHPDHFV